MAGRTCQAKLIASLVVFLHKRQQSKAVCFFFFILTLPPARLTNFQMPLRRRCMQHRRHRAHATGQTGGGLPQTGPGLTDCPTVASRLAAATVWMGRGRLEWGRVACHTGTPAAFAITRGCTKSHKQRKYFICLQIFRQSTCCNLLQLVATCLMLKMLRL